MGFKARILIAEDDDSVRGALAALLESEGYEVALAADGEEALVLFNPQRIHLALVDVNMPRRNGWEVCALLSHLAPTVPLVVITARPDARERATELSIAALLQKPLDLPELLATIGRLIKPHDEPQEVSVAA